MLMFKFNFNFVLFIFLILLSSCYNQSVKIAEADHDEVQFIAPIGNKIAGELFNTLKGELHYALEMGGVENALTVCNTKALKLTDSVALMASLEVSIKRITNKPRNPANKPDKFELKVLDRFEKLERKGKEFPEFYIQKITTPEEVSYNYYKPMKMDNLCLVCHGDESTLDANGIKKILELYPEDKATGYKKGDFRGLIRIKFVEPKI